MVVLTKDQSKLVADLAHQKTIYDQKSEELDEDVKRLRSQLKEPLRELIRKAQEAGVPERQIHVYGLGMGQRTQMYNFLMTPEDKLGLEATYKSLIYNETRTPGAGGLSGFNTHKEIPWTFTALDNAGRMWEVVDPEGNRYGINILSAGKIAMMKPNRDKPGEYSDWTPELIRQAKIHNPKWITQEEFKAIQAQDDEEDE